MANRTNIPSLLRGSRTRTLKSKDPLDLRKTNSGSLKHKTLSDEPGVRGLGAKRSQIESGLPHSMGSAKETTSRASVRSNEKLIKSRKAPERFNDPKEFGPNYAKSAKKGDYFSKGGNVHDEKWIQGAIKHPGSLRKTLNVKNGEKIPLSKIEKAEHSKNPTTRRRARLAETLRGFHH